MNPEDLVKRLAEESERPSLKRKTIAQSDLSA